MSRTRGVLRAVGHAVRVGAYAVWIALVVCTPLLGVWLSSSLAAYRNGPLWTSALLGLVLFPLAPLGWDRLATWRRNRKHPDRERILTFRDRFILRTLAINLAFLGIMLASYPGTAFRALSTRGDWILDGHDGPTANRIRGVLFSLADTLEGLYETTRDNPYSDLGDDNTDDGVEPTPNEPDEPLPDDDDPPAPLDEGARPRGWPLANTVHPVVAAMPDSVQTDYATVARYIADHEPDTMLRVKAVHDYIAARVVYDVEALETMQLPPYDPTYVFEHRSAVCAGYAKLFVAMADAIGIDAVYVTGDSRTLGDNVDGLGHAWNAVEIDGLWYLVDVTWDSGYVTESGAFKHEYRSDYLLTPPAIFGLDHLPEKPRWQLRADPLSQGDFMRQPMMKPSFYRQGLRLLSPRRSQISVSRDAVVEVAVPDGTYLMATAVTKDGRTKVECDVSGGARTRIRCPLPAPGRYQTQLFASRQRYGSYPFVGQIEFNRR